MALYPVLALYAFNMCKDVSVEPFVLLFAAQMVLLDRTNGEAAKSPRFLAELEMCIRDRYSSPPDPAALSLGNARPFDCCSFLFISSFVM